jgi:LTXXQ motif family protein
MGSALNSRALNRTWRNAGFMRNPIARAQLTAGAAMVGWSLGRGNGWWQHGNGGYGWVGPLFWPFAYFDIYDYALWGNRVGAPFWGYGYNDIYAGVFAPYGRDDLLGYLPPRTDGMPSAVPDRLAQMCGEDSRDVAGLPIELIQRAIELTEPQRAALDELSAASIAAAQTIRAACPTKALLTAPSRLAAMQQRIEAMIAAVDTVRPPLDKFHGLLDDEQKARLISLGEDQRRRATARNRNLLLAQSCEIAQPATQRWPTEEIDARLQSTDAQRASLGALHSASARASDMLRASCQAEGAVTPPARLAVVRNRLDTMLQAVKSVRAALDEFYGKLSDEQKAQFETIGPLRATAAERVDAIPRFDRRYRW